MAAKKTQAVKPEIIEKETLYEVIETFRDLDGVVYVKGSAYPVEKSNPAKARYDALLTENNKMKRPFIREV